MALTSAFKEAVSTGNVRRVRIMMKDSMLNDPTFSEFNAMKNAAQDLSGLYDRHDGRNLNYDKSTWDDSYMNELMVQIVGNFSHERVEHLQDVVKYLRPTRSQSQESYPNSERVADNETTNDKTYTQHPARENHKYHDQENNSDRGTKIISGAIIGAVVGGAIAAVASTSTIGGVAIGAVAGTVAATLITKG
ncbi:MAG: hypothetical protein AB6733_23875 [Clostridiaceae bacterium]